MASQSDEAGTIVGEVTWGPVTDRDVDAIASDLIEDHRATAERLKLTPNEMVQADVDKASWAVALRRSNVPVAVFGAQAFDGDSVVLFFHGRPKAYSNLREFARVMTWFLDRPETKARRYTYAATSDAAVGKALERRGFFFLHGSYPNHLYCRHGL